MSSIESTCWTLIRGAAAGAESDRTDFVRLYGDALRAFFCARWKAPLRSQDVDDALQEVMLECFKQGGALERAEPRSGGFRAYLYGVARRVALRHESRGAKRALRGADDRGINLDQVEHDETSVSHAFERAWARSIMREAGERLSRKANAEGGALSKRVKLLEQRFGQGRPVRDIANEWNEDRDAIHREIRRAREDFRSELRIVASFHLPGATDQELDAECARLQELLA